jgi:hypothetical protein
MSVDGWTVAGTLALGLTVGWLICNFVGKAQNFGISALVSVVAIVAGGTTLALWRFASGEIPKEGNCYFIGVFLSILMIRIWNWGQDRETAKPSTSA